MSAASYDVENSEEGSRDGATGGLTLLPVSVIDMISNASPVQQMAISGVAGCAAGYVGAKVGKLIAITTGIGIIGIQIASEKGYICINWNRIQCSATRLMDGKIDQLNKLPISNIDADKAKSALRNKPYVVAGFLAGICFGFALA